MALKHFLSVSIFMLTPLALQAQVPIVLSGDDVYFEYTPSKTYAKTGTKVPSQYSAADAPRHCGFSIRGNHRSHANPRVEWDLNIEEIIAGETRLVGITAGTFNVTGRVRQARPAIVGMLFSIEGQADPLTARIVGTPNSDNGIQAVLDTEPALPLFDAFSNTRLVTIRLEYADKTVEQLQVRALHDARKFGGGKNSYFNQCLRADTPELLQLSQTP